MCFIEAQIFPLLLYDLMEKISSFVRVLAPVRSVGHTGVSAVNETSAERRGKKNFFLRAVNWNVLANCPFSASIKLLVLR
jgi:hypothetical protein